MNTSKIFGRTLLIICGVLFISINVNAQRGRHYERRSYYSYSRPVVSVGFGVRSYYPHYYSSYYAPGYGYYPTVVPYFGLRIGALPFGYSTFYMGPNPFYYYDGIYYRPYGNEYEVTAPPLGAKVSELPKNAKVTVINGQKYYVYDGTYYKETINDNNEVAYTVVGTNGKLNTTDNTDNGNSNDNAVDNNSSNNNGNNNDNNNTVDNSGSQSNEIGSRVDVLPTDSKPIVINKQKYYLAPSGVYYQEVVDGNKIHYEIVGKSSDLK